MGAVVIDPEEVYGENYEQKNYYKGMIDDNVQMIIQAFVNKKEVNAKNEPYNNTVSMLTDQVSSANETRKRCIDKYMDGVEDDTICPVKMSRFAYSALQLTTENYPQIYPNKSDVAVRERLFYTSLGLQYPGTAVINILNTENNDLVSGFHVLFNLVQPDYPLPVQHGISARLLPKLS